MEIGELQEKLTEVESRIKNACARSQRRREDVLLCAVTKTHPVAILQLAYDLGLRDFGENRVQELLQKRVALPNDICWHLIGHLQSNKAKYIAPFVSMVHSIDSIETAREVSKRCQQVDRRVDVLVEVNISGESQKAGVALSETEGLIKAVLIQAPQLELRGLMGVASYESDVERTRAQFASLRNLRVATSARFPQLERFDQLSMGMTNDFEVAIEEGATIVRIGSALFGERS